LDRTAQPEHETGGEVDEPLRLRVAHVAEVHDDGRAGAERVTDHLRVVVGPGVDGGDAAQRTGVQPRGAVDRCHLGGRSLLLVLVGLVATLVGLLLGVAVRILGVLLAIGLGEAEVQHRLAQRSGHAYSRRTLVAVVVPRTLDQPRDATGQRRRRVVAAAHLRKSGMSRSSGVGRRSGASSTIRGTSTVSTGELSFSTAATGSGATGSAGTSWAGGSTTAGVGAVRTAAGAAAAAALSFAARAARPAGPSLESKPAAMTVTRTSSPSASSMTAPKMMFASGCAASCTRRAASWISNRPRSLPPWIESSTP